MFLFTISVRSGRNALGNLYQINQRLIYSCQPQCYSNSKLMNHLTRTSHMTSNKYDTCNSTKGAVVVFQANTTKSFIQLKKIKHEECLRRSSPAILCILHSPFLCIQRRNKISAVPYHKMTIIYCTPVGER